MSARPLGGRDVAVIGLLVALLAAFLAANYPLLVVGLMVAIVFVSWIVSRAELVLMVLVAALPWEAMLRYPSATLSLIKLLGMALVVAYAFRLASRDEEIRTSPIIGIALLFGLVIGVSLIVSPEPTAGVAKAFRYAFFIGFLFLVSQLVRDRRGGIDLLRAYCASATVAGVVGLAAFLSGSMGRAAGPIEDPNDFGYLLATVVPIAVFLYIEDRRLRPAWGAALAVLLAATAATLSRGALVGLGALVLWAIFTGRIGAKRLVLAGVGIFALGIVAFALWSPVIDQHLEEKNRIGATNVESRTTFWAAAAQMSMDHPLFGIGPARFGVEAPEYVRNNPNSLRDPVVHDAYLEVLAEDGPLALGLLLLMMLTSWGMLTQGEREGRRRGEPEAVRFTGAIKGMLIVAVVSAIFLSEQTAAPIWLGCALAASGAVLRYRSAPGPIRAVARIPA
jgi:O-antigen ligase